MQLNLCGPAYKHSSIDVNYQRCVNMFPTSSGPEGRGGEKSILLPTAGLLELIDLGVSPCRCLGTVGGYVYAVIGNTVHEITINYLTKTATSSTIGTISTSLGTVYMAANPTQIMWVDGTSDGYIYTQSTGVFEQISDEDFPGGDKVVFLDGYFIVNAPNTGTFFTSALNNGLAWDASDVATAESGTDNILSFGITKGELWILGPDTTEIWYNAANVSGSPFSPRDGMEIQIGCGAEDSVVVLDDLLIWLDNRGFIVQSDVSPFIRSNNSGYDLKIISTEAITTEVLSYSRRDDAIAMGYNDRGHLMYQISFPSAKKTWVYDYSTKVWHERAFFKSFESEFQHHLGQFYTSFSSLHLMAGERSGKIYLVSDKYYTDDGTPIHRIRTSPVLYDNSDFRLFVIDRIDLRMGIGESTLTDPHITLRYSHDGGHSWSHHLVRSIGAVGEFAKLITWNRLGVGREWVFEFTIVEAMPFSIIEAVFSTGTMEE